MAPNERELVVWCFGRRAGVLRDERPGPRFGYDARWLADGMPALSYALPVNGTHDPSAAGAYFGGLLPEGVPREQLARRLGVSADNDFSLLAAVGGDTAGALSLLPPGDAPPSASDDDVRWLSDVELIDLIDNLPSRPMHADDDGQYRLSLAGAQDKIPVVYDGTRVGLTNGRTPSTHILKTPIERLTATVANEAFCLQLGRAIGLDTVDAAPKRVEDREFLLVRRYDRAGEAPTTRLHQEDFCQALGIPTTQKYQAEGGPSLAQCFALVRNATDVPALEIRKLLDAVALSFIVGNHDAHGKNFSLLYLPEHPKPALAPLYDIVSTFAYHRSHDLSRKMAMNIGREYRPDHLRQRHLDRLLEEARLGAAPSRRRLRALAERAPRAADDLRRQFIDDGWDSPTIELIVEIVRRRSHQLDEIAAPVPKRGTQSP